MPAASHRSRDIGRPLTRSSLAVISETTRPAPKAAVKRRKGASVTPDIGARRTRFATLISPIFKGLRGEDSEPVTDFSFSGSSLIAVAGAYLEHNSCAVNHLAYTLDNSLDLASAVQQHLLCMQLSGIALFLGPGHDKGSAPAPTLPLPRTRQQQSQCRNLSRPQPSLSQPDAGCVPAREGRSSI